MKLSIHGITIVTTIITIITTIAIIIIIIIIITIRSSILEKSELLRNNKRTNVNLKDRFRNLMKTKSELETNDFVHCQNLLCYFYDQYRFETSKLPTTVKSFLRKKFGDSETLARTP